MKTFLNKILIGLTILLLLISIDSINAQSLVIKANITLDQTTSLEKYTVKILNIDTDSVKTFDSKKQFIYRLDYGHVYVIVVSKSGYESKSIYVDTRCNSNYSFKYTFFMDLKTKQITEDYVCQAGGIFYNQNKDEFDFFYNR